MIRPTPIPLTVIGGYLGAGKTTLVNHVLRHAGGRRIGVIVNDFGELAIDADLLEGAARDGDVIGLANGCVCCTVGAGLHEALESLIDRPEPLDHVVIEVSGVAAPAVTAGWATVPPFEPAGVIVLADATSVQQRSRDRYVGPEVRRQLAGADVLVVTKTDLCEPAQAASARVWLGDVAPGAMQVDAVHGELPVEVVLGPQAGVGGLREPVPPPVPVSAPDAGASRNPAVNVEHAQLYESWAWTSAHPVGRDALDRFVTSLPDTVVRVKGRVQLDTGSWMLVQVVGRRIEVTPTVAAAQSELVAIALRPTPNPFVLHFG